LFPRCAVKSGVSPAYAAPGKELIQLLAFARQFLMQNAVYLPRCVEPQMLKATILVRLPTMCDAVDEQHVQAIRIVRHFALIDYPIKRAAAPLGAGSIGANDGIRSDQSLLPKLVLAIFSKVFRSFREVAAVEGRGKVPGDGERVKGVHGM
jgi:hypothetical protein